MTFPSFNDVPLPLALVPAPARPVRHWLLEGDVPALEVTGADDTRRVFCNDCCEGLAGSMAECMAWALAHTLPGAGQCPILTGLAW